MSFHCCSRTIFTGGIALSLSGRNKFDILLRQINLPETLYPVFSTATLDKVIVHRQQKRWDVYISLNKALSFDSFFTFLQHMEQAFNNIATLRLFIVSTEKVQDEKELYLYWCYFLTTMEDLLPSHLTKLQQATIKEQQLYIYVGSEAEAVNLQRKIEKPFTYFVEQYSLQRLHIHIEVKTDEAELAQFREQTENENEQFIRQINGHHEKQRKKERATNDPFTIGSVIRDEPIRIVDITEEEKRVTIQGYVFSKEIINLRSGRQLLMLKLTDYTDSIELKLFSRNAEDEKVFSQAKEGIWIKARGRVQADTYSHELIMMPYDLMEITIDERKDEAEAGKKRVELHAHTTMSQLDAVISPKRLIERAATWGHEAIAITDHAGVQGFPEAYYASLANDIKVIYGV